MSTFAGFVQATGSETVSSGCSGNHTDEDGSRNTTGIICDASDSRTRTRARTGKAQDAADTWVESPQTGSASVYVCVKSTGHQPKVTCSDVTISSVC